MVLHIYLGHHTIVSIFEILWYINFTIIHYRTRWYDSMLCKSRNVSIRDSAVDIHISQWVAASHFFTFCNTGQDKEGQ